MKRLKALRVHVILLVVLFVYVFFAFVFKGSDMRFMPTSIATYQQEWELVIDGNSAEFITLPNEIDVNANQTYQLKTNLTNDFFSKQTLLFRSSLQYLKVYLDDELIYENLDQSTTMPPVASMWNTIELPENSHNKELVFEIVSPYQVMASQINGVYFGDLGSIYLFILTNHAYIFAFSMIIVLLSVVLLSLAAFFKTQINRQVQLLSLFTLLLGLWIVAESRMLQFFIGSQFIHAALAYLMLASVLIPLLIYVKDYVLIKNKISLKALIGIHLINFMYVIFAQVIGFATFFDSVQTTNYLHVVTIVALLLFLGMEVFILKSKPAINFLKRVSVLLIAGVAELINFFLKHYENTSIYLVLGLMVFLIIQIIDYLKVANNIIHQSKMAKEFEKLATIDPLTQSNNRMAFDRDILTLFNNKSSGVIRISFFDVNNLKTINDTFGHAIGDEAIVLSYELIEETFKDIGKTYRVGGDEFACIIESADQEIYTQKIIELREKIEAAQPNLPYKLEIANGSALYDPNLEESISDVLRTADLQMYKNKQEQKQT